AFAKTGERDVEPAQATYGIVISSPPSSTVSSPLLLLLLLLLFGASAFSLLLFPSPPHAANNKAGLRATVKTGSFADRNLSNIYRSQQHTSELQSRFELVCRLLLEKRKLRMTRPTSWTA